MLLCYHFHLLDRYILVQISSLLPRDLILIKWITFSNKLYSSISIFSFIVLELFSSILISSDKLWNATRAFILGKTNKLYKVYKVQTQSVDKFCSINNVSTIDILKIDVEGNEINVIQGAIKKLNSCSIIYAEVIDQKKLFDKKFAQLKQTLEENNFILLNVKNILSVSIFSHLKAVDTTFVHKNLLN